MTEFKDEARVEGLEANSDSFDLDAFIDGHKALPIPAESLERIDDQLSELSVVGGDRRVNAEFPWLWLAGLIAVLLLIHIFSYPLSDAASEPRKKRPSKHGIVEKYVDNRPNAAIASL